MGTKVALGGSPRTVVDVDRVIGAGLQTRGTTDAPIVIEIDHAVLSLVERHGGTDLDARSIGAVIAAKHCSRTLGLGKLAVLDPLHPGAKRAQRHVVFGLAGNRAGVATDTGVLIENEAVVHAARG